ncbi:MAG: cyanophycinase [Phormidesmis priestleyi Ana]|uniref:Cyanophycinase n=1 Tax=Phormidesmis priestleyi Ana TaxID=1666911 RepID=A0A0N8KNW9_9CYAN|nr:MAG: cyanophycinase [Phormidesmis priestleyi Ana]
MLELKFRLAERFMAISTRYPVMIIGGAEDKVNDCIILRAFFESAGGEDAIIGVIPAASREPTLVGDRYYQIFTGMGAKQVKVLDIRLREECEEARWLEALEECTGVFVTGGDQVRLCDLVGDTQLLKTIKEKLKNDVIVIAGTSAGAAMMGEKMIAGGSSGESPNPALVDLSNGLGIVPELLVDQHFHNRNRMARLLSAIAANPDKLGIGIDEDTCIAMLGDGTFEVLGKGTITIVDPGSLTHTNDIHPHQRDNTEDPNTEGYDTEGYDTEGYDTEGYNTEGYDTENRADIPAPLSLHNLKLHVLKQGDRYDYKKRSVL